MSSFFDAINKISTHPQFWLWVGMAIAIGILLGLAFILVIVVRRRKYSVNSLIGLEDCIGLSATVEVPFDENTSGKVNIQLENRTIGCFAYSNQPHQYCPGDAVVVVGIKGKKVWVIPAQEFQAS